MECTSCGGPAMPETTIRLRRGVLGVRAVHSQGVYCPSCKRGSPLVNERAQRPRLGGFWQARLVGAHMGAAARGG